MSGRGTLGNPRNERRKGLRAGAAAFEDYLEQERRALMFMFCPGPEYTRAFKRWHAHWTVLGERAKAEGWPADVVEAARRALAPLSRRCLLRYLRLKGKPASADALAKLEAEKARAAAKARPRALKSLQAYLRENGLPTEIPAEPVDPLRASISAAMAASAMSAVSAGASSTKRLRGSARSTAKKPAGTRDSRRPDCLGPPDGCRDPRAPRTTRPAKPRAKRRGLGGTSRPRGGRGA